MTRLRVFATLLCALAAAPLSIPHAQVAGPPPEIITAIEIGEAGSSDPRRNDGGLPAPPINGQMTTEELSRALHARRRSAGAGPRRSG